MHLLMWIHHYIFANQLELSSLHMQLLYRLVIVHQYLMNQYHLFVLYLRHHHQILVLPLCLVFHQHLFHLFVLYLQQIHLHLLHPFDLLMLQHQLHLFDLS